MICLPSVIYWGYQQIKTKKQDNKIKKILTSFLLYGLVFFFIFGMTIPSFQLGTIANTAYFMVDNEHFKKMQNNEYLYGFTLPDSIINTQNLNNIDAIINGGEKKFKTLKKKEDKILDNRYKGYYKFGVIRFGHDMSKKWDFSYLSSRSYLSDNSNFLNTSKMSNLLKKSGDSIHLDTLHIRNLPNVLHKFNESDKFDESDSIYLAELSNLSDLSNESDLSSVKDIYILAFLPDKSYRLNFQNQTSRLYLYFRFYVFQSDTLHKSDTQYLSDLSDLSYDFWSNKSDLSDLLKLSDLSDKLYLGLLDQSFEWNLFNSNSYLSDKSYLNILNNSYSSYTSYSSYLSNLNGWDKPDVSERNHRLHYYAPTHIRNINKSNFFWSKLFSKYDNKYKNKHQEALNSIGKRYKSVSYDTLKLTDYMNPRIDSLKVKVDNSKIEPPGFSYWSKEVDTMQLYLSTLNAKIPDVSFYTPLWFYQLEPDFRRAENARRYLKYGFIDYLKWVLHYLPFLCILLLALYYSNLNSFFSALYLSLCVFLVILFLGGKFFDIMEWEFKDYLYFNYVGILYGLIALGVLCTQAWSKRNNALTVFGFHIILVTIMLFFFLGIICDYHVFMYQWIEYTVPCWVLFTIQAIGISAVLLMAHIRSLPRS